MTVETCNQNCKQCGAIQSVKTKIFSVKGRINEVWSLVCYECGELSTRQQDLVDEAEGN